MTAEFPSRRSQSKRKLLAAPQMLVPVLTRPTPHNEDYLATKARSGHLIPGLDTLPRLQAVRDP